MKIKQILNILWKEFVYGGHLVSLGIPAIICLTIILLNKKFSWILLMVGYLLTFINYRYNYNKGIEKDSLTNPDRVQYLAKYLKFSQVLIIIYFFILFVTLVFYTNFKIILFSFFFLIIGIFYTHQFKKITKRIIGFKNFYIGASWALFVVFVGFYYSSLNRSLFFLFLFIFLRLFLNTIFFDIKDIETDEKEGLKTVPVIFGKEKTLKFLHVLNFLSLTPIIIGVWVNFLPGAALVLLCFYLYDFYYLEKAKDKNINIQKLSYWVADCEFLLWPIVLILGKSILSIL